MNIVDSSGWIEYFLDGPNAQFFSEPILAQSALLVPSISIYEVFKRLTSALDEDTAKAAVAHMCQARVVPLDATAAIDAAALAASSGLPMADSVILSCARSHGATLWTQDADFEGMADVRYTAWQPG